MYRTLLTLFGVLFSWGAVAQSQYTPRVDSLLHVAQTSKDTVRIRALQTAATELFSTSDYAPAMTYAQQGLAESKRLGWLRGKAQGLEVTGMLYSRSGNFTQGQENLLATLPLWRQLRERHRETRVMMFIANLLAENQQFKQALSWYKRALATAQAAHAADDIQLAYLGLGLYYARQKDLAGALRYYQKALALVNQHNAVTVNVAYLHNNLADAYISLNQAQKALPHLFKAIQIARKRKNRVGENLFEATLAQAYEQLGNVNMAIYHALNARQTSIKVKNTPLLINLNDLLDTLYIRQGNYRLARWYSAQNRLLEAQARRQEQERKVAELQGRYDTKEKERNIQMLRQQNRIQQLATLQQRTLRNAAFVTAGLLLLAVGILFNRYRLRQRTVRQLNEQQKVLEARDQEKELLLREKTLLLQEVHHRVKNNLQIVLSLLNTQVNTLNEPAAIGAIRDSQSRVQTMALIHQNLYQSESLARIDMHRYFQELTEAIVRAFRTEAAAVALTLDVAPLQLNTHTAVPLGLIVNELVTNALKYAFPNGRPDRQVRVHLSQLAPDTFQLQVADNGVGLPAAVVPSRVMSLGLQLVTGLAQQMKAFLKVESSTGTEFTLTFHEMPVTAVSSGS